MDEHDYWSEANEHLERCEDCEQPFLTRTFTPGGPRVCLGCVVAEAEVKSGRTDAA